MKLQLTTKLAHFVSVWDLGKFIQEVYDLPQRFEFEESPNDVDYVVEIQETESMDEYKTKELEEAIRLGGTEIYRLHTMLQALVNRELLSPGTYVVSVSW